eukprot:TRINITY_DN24352_c0_g6_i1.p1 TRINITY_DN24352_c0_g6~~TRINITY_DN24352_c0_g6_i1.p1  ORF type:complete len:366 (+),score=79.16 TRINITY_DN24352_c0_g6_i1:93-1190(+)
MKATGKEDMSQSSKFSRVDALTQKSKAMTVGMEGWVANHKNQSAMLEAHNDAISSMSKNLRMLEQQVKAIARVMASQNEKRDVAAPAGGGVSDEVMRAIHESREDIMNRVSKELSTTVATKNELSKRIHVAEEKLSELILQKDDQQTNERANLMHMIEKTQSRLNVFESSLAQESTRLKEFSQQLHDSLKKVMHNLQVTVEQERVSRDRTHMAQQMELQKLMETQRNYVVSAAKELKNHMDKTESSLLDKTKALGAELAKEMTARSDAMKQLKNHNLDTLNSFRMDMDKSMHTFDVETERKVSAVGRMIPELRMALEHEKTSRESAVTELSRAIAQERKDRDFDEDKLMSMISATMHAIDKMHKS